MKVNLFRFVAVLLIVMASGVLALSLPVSVHAEPPATVLEAAPQQPAPPLLSDIQAVAAGKFHTCALTTDGGVKCWGENSFAQLGDGTTEWRLTPADVVGLSSGVQSIAAGGEHTCALTTGGGVKCWGANDSGQLGDGTTEWRRLTPVDVVGLGSGVQSLAAGWNHTCAVMASGGVKCWGNNDDLTPVDVAGLSSGVQAIAVGDGHACALMAGGGVKCWGSNSFGELGDGTTTSRLAPMDVNGLDSGVQAITAGGSHTCALTESGGAKCWGWNRDRQLGDGTTTDRLTPVDVSGLSSGVQAIAASSDYTCAVTAGGGVKCWGNNGAGQLGDGTVEERLAPVDVIGLGGGVQAIAAGSSHTCALTADSGVKCWGSNFYGELGNGIADHSRITPADVSGLSSGVQAIAAGSFHTCAVISGGGVKCWGENLQGQLGNGRYEWERLTPVDVVGLSSGVQAITVGQEHTCALTVGGGVKCWGANDSGQLGDGMEFGLPLPVDVEGLSNGVRAIAAGAWYSCALTAGGGVKCWGKNEYGQLGDGTTEDRRTPVDVVGLSSGVQAIAAGGNHTCALMAGGGVKCWGKNEYGQLGDGTNTDRWAPVDVEGLSSGVQAIAAALHTCALMAGGGVKCWGWNWSGQLGDVTTTDRYTPVDVVGLSSGVQAIAAGTVHTCAVTAGGGVKCWGSNGSGQLGDGTTANRYTPMDVMGLSGGVQAIAAGVHTCALTADGKGMCWGNNQFGQLGVNPAWMPVDVVAGPTIHGRVLEINLDPIVAAAVTFAGPPGQSIMLHTDAAGIFTFTATATGMYTITVEKPDYSFFPGVVRWRMPSDQGEPQFIGVQSPDIIPLTFLPSVEREMAETGERKTP